MDPDEVINILIDTAVLLNKKAKAPAAGLADSYEGLYHSSAMFRRNPEKETAEIKEYLATLHSILGEVGKDIEKVYAELDEIKNRGIKGEVEKFVKMLKEQKKRLNEIDGDYKRIPETVRAFYRTNNEMYNMALILRNDYQLSKDKMYSRKQ
jgi:hypothetical protein